MVALTPQAQDGVAQRVNKRIRFLGWRPGVPVDTLCDLWPEPQTVGASDPQCWPPTRRPAAKLCAGPCVHWADLSTQHPHGSHGSERPGELLRVTQLGDRTDLEASTTGHRATEMDGLRVLRPVLGAQPSLGCRGRCPLWGAYSLPRPLFNIAVMTCVK